MSQISLRLKPELYKIIRLYSKKKGITLASAFKDITADAIAEWKVDFLLSEYQTGNIRMKDAWLLSELPLNAFFKCLEDSNIEPPHTELMELKSEETKNKIIT